MKKILSIALCLFLLIAMGSMVFAADNTGDDVVIGENAINIPYMNIGEMGRKYVVFIAPATGTYTFTCTSEEGAVCIEREEGGYHSMYLGHKPYKRTLVEGQVVSIMLWSPYTRDESYPNGYDVTFTVEIDSPESVYENWVHLELGANTVVVTNEDDAAYGLPCVFPVKLSGFYRITTTHDNAYLFVDGEGLDGSGQVYDLCLNAGSYLEIMVGTSNIEPDTVTFNIEAISVANTQLQEGVNNVYVSLERATYGLECKFTAPVAGLYEITAISENALVAVGTGSWMRVGESVEVTVAENEDLKIMVADVEAEAATVVLSITLKEELSSHEHEYETVVIEPSCAYQGYTTYKCKICGESYDDDYVDATGEHVYTETENLPATCTEDGYITMACMCGESETTVLPMTGHTPSEVILENEVTGDCDTDASYDEVVRCETCGEEISREHKVVTALGHQGAEAVRENEVAATCANDGAYDLVVYCKNCGTEMSRKHEVVTATGAHVYATETDRKAATCTEDGYVIKACGCGKTETTTLTKTGHDNAAAVKENDKAATCTVDGSYEMVVYCKTCKAEVSREKTTVPAAGHDNAVAVKENDKAATCTVDGSYEMVIYCKTCKAEVSREKTVVPATGHKEATAVRENEIFATCGSDGSYDLVVYCQNCNVEMSRKHETVKSTGDHVYANLTERVDATCTEDGYEIKACGCGATEKTTLTKTGHDNAEAVKENEKAATCTQDGSFEMVVYCKTCQAEISREKTVVPATGHDNAEAVKENEKANSCTEDGSFEMVVYCKTCKAEISREKTVVPATGHDNAEAVKENEKANSCTEDGSFEMVVYCKTCKAEVSREKTVVPATGHDNAEAVKENEKANSCTEDGSFEMVVYCKTCKAEVSREKTVVPATGHKEASAVHENEIYATCGSDGSYDLVVYCQYCKIELSRKHEIVKSTGEHVYANVTERVDPTCTEDGYEIKACGCGAAETFTLTATGHIAAEAVQENEIAPTCTEDGTYDVVEYCSVCAVELSREAIVVEALGHTPAEAVKENEIAPTCTQDGSFDMVVYCSVCGEELSRETTAVPSTGEHVYANETERKDATCTAAGYVIMSCGCGETLTTELPMIEHTAGAAMNENEVAATCTTDGSYDVVIRCSACEAELERSTVTVSATGHSFGEWTTAKEPTATEEGTEKRTCACGEEETRSIPALGVEPTEPETKPAETKPAETKPATEPTEPVSGEKEGGNAIVVVIIAVSVVAAGAVSFVVFKKKK